MARYPDRPIVGVLAVVPRGPRTLLVRRSNPPDAGLWGFPGGKQELGETVLAAAERELFEETGVAAGATDVLTTLDAITRDADGGVRFHYTLVVVRCHWRAGEGEVGSDAAELRWVTAEEAAVLPCSRHVGRLLALAAAGLRVSG